MRIAGPVLCFSDLEPSSDHALCEGAALARDAAVPLVVCHVLPELVGFRPLFPQLRVLDREAAEKIRAWATGALEQQITRALGHDAPRPQVRLESGSPHAVAIELAQELRAGLVVVLGPPERAGANAVKAERIAHHAGCPILLSVDHGGQTVLAATDFSDPALPAVRAGQEEAARLGLPLYVLHAVDLATAGLGLPEIVSSGHIAIVIEARRQEARFRLEELSRRLGGGLVLLREGPAVDAILGAAESIDAARVVLGVHGRTGPRRFTLGSVAEGVLRHARRSTLVAPLGEAAA